jgi:hypothetical protein
MICVPCCDVRDDFLIKTMFGSSLPLVVCKGEGASLIYIMCVCLRILVSNTYCVVCPVLPISLDCHFLYSLTFIDHTVITHYFRSKCKLSTLTRARLFKILDKVVHWTTTYPVDS